MALEIGNSDATSGMSKAIYDELENQLSGGMKPDDVEKVRPSWKKLAFAIATGVVNHIKDKMEITGIQATGAVNISVTGTVSGTNVTGTGTGSVNTNQSGSTTGHIK